MSALFSGYLASVGSQNSDLQTLLSDTYITLHAATGMPRTHSTLRLHVRVICPYVYMFKSI